MEKPHFHCICLFTFFFLFFLNKIASAPIDAPRIQPSILIGHQG